jgi:hypothetical protein
VNRRKLLSGAAALSAYATLILAPVVAWGQPSAPRGCPIAGGCAFTGPITAGAGLIVNGARGPVQTDDTASAFGVGNTWVDPSGKVFQGQDLTAGFAMWQQVQSNALPGDVIGLNVSAASYTLGGAACTANEVLTFTGGVQVTVNTCATGVPATWTVTQSRMHACMPATPTAISPLVTTSGDLASVWNLTVKSPVALYGNRLLTRCYVSNAAHFIRSDTGEGLAIGFLSDGSMDYKTLDGFVNGGVPMAQYVTHTSGPEPRMDIWYDQSGNANNATQGTAANRPVMFPGRLLGNSRSVMFDARVAASSWDPLTPTFLTLPAGVAVNGNNFTVAVVAGVNSNRVGANLLHVGAQSTQPMVYLSQFNANGSTCQDDTTSKAVGPGFPDEATLIMCVGNASTTTFYVGNKVSAGPVGNAASISGGTLGEVWNAVQSNPADEAMAVIVPWALTTAEQRAFQASVAATFGIPMQKRGVIVSLGDSHIESWGYPYQQNILRQAMTLLNRPDISLVGDAQSATSISAFVGSADWAGTIVPTLAAYSGNKYVLLEGGYNDIATQSVAQIEASYTSLAASTHAAGAKTICDTDVIRNSTLANNNGIQAVAAWMRATPAVCDYVFDPQINPTFNAASGPWSLPWFEQQDTGVHLSAAGNGLQAAMFAQFVLTNKLFQ